MYTLVFSVVFPHRGEKTRAIGNAKAFDCMVPYANMHYYLVAGGRSRPHCITAWRHLSFPHSPTSLAILPPCGVIGYNKCCGCLDTKNCTPSLFLLRWSRNQRGKHSSPMQQRAYLVVMCMCGVSIVCPSSIVDELVVNNPHNADGMQPGLNLAALNSKAFLSRRISFKWFRQGALL